MDEKAKQQYLKYLEKDTWTENEVVLLLHGAFPESVAFAKYILNRTTYSETREELGASVSLGILHREISMSFRSYGNVDDDCYVYISTEIIEWAKNKKNIFPNFPYRDIENIDIGNEFEKSENCQTEQAPLDDISQETLPDTSQSVIKEAWEKALQEELKDFTYAAVTNKKKNRDVFARQLTDYIEVKITKTANQYGKGNSGGSSNISRDLKYAEENIVPYMMNKYNLSKP